MSRDPHRLTPRQARFVDQYLVDLNGAAAIVRAGYTGRKARQSASRMLRRPAVQAAIAERTEALARQATVSAQSVIDELAAIAFHDVRKLFRDDDTLKAPHELDDESAAALAGLEVEQLFEGRGESRTLVGRLHKVKRWDKCKALELLGRYLELFEDKVKLEVQGGVSIYLPENGRGPVPGR